MYFRPVRGHFLRQRVKVAASLHDQGYHHQFLFVGEAAEFRHVCDTLVGLVGGDRDAFRFRYHVVTDAFGSGEDPPVSEHDWWVVVGFRSVADAVMARLRFSEPEVP